MARKLRIGLATLASTAVVAVPALASAEPAAENPLAPSDGFVGPSPAQMQSPQMQQQMQQAMDAYQAEQAGLDSPAQQQARRQSQDAYQGLSDQQAKTLAVGAFPELFQGPAQSGLDLPDGYKLVRYMGKDTALVAPTGSDLLSGRPPTESGTSTTGDGSLVESMLPLRARTESGALRPIDMNLVAQGDHLEAANPTTETQLPFDLTQGVQMPTLGISVEPAHAAQADAASVTRGSTAFYANIQTDTDFFTAPRQAGFEALWQLRSVDSPENLVLRVGLPAGAKLRASDIANGAEIVAGKNVLALVKPPQAVDADGTPVQVEMKPNANGDQLDLTVKHQGEDLKYPIAVDPDFYEGVVWTWGGTCPADRGSFGVPGWRWEQYPWSYMWPSCNNGEGAYTDVPAGVSYGTNDYGQWVWAPPAGTYLSQVHFGGEALQHIGDPICTWTGIWSPEGHWMNGAVNRCDNFMNGDNLWWPTDNSDNTVAISQAYSAYGHYQYYEAWTDLGGYEIWVSDRYSPWFTSVPSDAGWADDGAAVHSRTVRADDTGLGVNDIAFNGPNSTTSSQVVTQHGTRTCGQTVTQCTNPTYLDATFNYSLPEGLNRVSLAASDYPGHVDSSSAAGTPRGWYEAIDRSAPVVATPSGSLYDNRTAIRGDQSYDLNVSATDGSTTSDAARRSGVKQIDVWVDDDEDQPDFTIARTEAECNLTAGGCPPTLSGTWHLKPYDLGEGNHTISVVATDKLGHESTQQFTVSVTTDIDPGTLTLVASPPALDGSYNIVATALEARTVDRPVSGISSMELLIGGKTVEDYAPGCAAGGCDLVHVFHVSAAQASGPSAPSVAWYDQAGNGDVQDVDPSRPFASYAHFGYNDEFDDAKKLRAASNGGANTIRLQINWCEIADGSKVTPPQPSPSDRVDRASWEWSAYNRVFQKIVAQNSQITDPAKQLHVIAVLQGTPRWARDDPSRQDICTDKDPRDDAYSISTTPPKRSYVTGTDSDWHFFVAEFLRRYGPGSAYAGANLVAVEPWNEPNLPKFWGGSPGGAATTTLRQDAPDRYAELVNAASDAVDQVAPSVLVLAGGMSPISAKGSTESASPKAYMDQAKFLSRAVPSIVAGRVDGLSIHSYRDGARSDKAALKGITERFKMLVGGAGALASKPQWITEIGFPSLSGPLSGVSGQTFDSQRRRLKLSYKKLDGIPNSDIVAFIVHRLADDSGEPRGYGVLTQGATACKQSGNPAESIYQRLAAYRGVPQTQAVCPPQ